LLVESRRLLAGGWGLLEEAIIVGGLLFLLLLNVPWLDGLFEEIGLSDDVAANEVVLVAVLVGLYAQFHRLNSIVAAGASMKRQYIADPNALYPVLLARAQAIRRPHEREIDVLGMTLYTAWPSLSFWLQHDDVRDWTVRLASLSPAYHSDLIPEKWGPESAHNIESARLLGASRSFLDRKIDVTVLEYEFMPCVHGFRLGNGDVFISFLRWSEDGKIGRDGYSYEFIPCEDESDGADAQRALFDSWFTRATSEIRVSP
jgi:hypothetical protein